MDVSSVEQGIAGAPVVVAVALLAMLGLIVIVAFIRYPADKVAQPLNWVGTVFGGLLGMIGTYYFQGHHNQVVQAQLRTLIDQAGAAKEEVYEHAGEDLADLWGAYEALEKENQALRKQLSASNPTP